MAIARPYPWIKQSADFIDVGLLELGAAIDEYDTVQERFSDGESFPVWLYNTARDAWWFGMATLTTGTPNTITLVGDHWSRQGFNFSITDDSGFGTTGTVTLTVGPGPIPVFYGIFGEAAAFAVPTGGTETEVVFDTTTDTTGGASAVGLAKASAMVTLAGDPDDATEYTVYFSFQGFAIAETLAIDQTFMGTTGFASGAAGLPGLYIVHNGSSSVPFKATAATQMYHGT